MAYKILVIPDSFKNCLSATDVGKYIKNGIKKVLINASIKVLPIADGGEGSVFALINSLGGEIIKVKVNDPLLRPINSFFGVLPDKHTAIIEMAAASGIELISSEERNPLLTTTYGTGELILEALNRGCKKIIIGIGGSATNDGGVGMAKALGVKFLDSNAKEVEQGGGFLNDVSKIDLSEIDKRVYDTEIIVACDVKNTLFGKDGASFVYGPQKGADTKTVKILDNNLMQLAKTIKNDLGIDIANIKGGGAAGGLGAGLYAFCGAQIKPGFETLANLMDLEREIAASDIIITAEGKVDYQTLFGKTPAGVGELALKHKKPVFVFAGNCTSEIQNLNSIGISSLIPITRYPCNLSEAISEAPIWLETSATELAKILMVGKTI